jgi:hypothetical protein
MGQSRDREFVELIFVSVSTCASQNDFQSRCSHLIVLSAPNILWFDLNGIMLHINYLGFESSFLMQFEVSDF